MKNIQTAIATPLGIFSLGNSYFLYSFLQYFLTPLCWWFAQKYESLAWMNDIFYYYEVAGRELFSAQSVCYSIIGIVSFFTGYLGFPKGSLKIKNHIVTRKWAASRAETIFWLLVFSGFAFKTLKLIAGLSVDDVVEMNIKHSYISNSLIVFYLSFNWFNLVALIVIMVAHQESKIENNISTRRLRIIAYSYFAFYFIASLTTGGKTATFFPLLGFLIVQKYYSKATFSAFRAVSLISLLVIAIFSLKLLLAMFFGIEGADETQDLGLRFALFYVLFYRVNMSHVIEGVITYGQQAFPDGTIANFWVNINPYLSDRGYAFDGNEFGRAIGVAAPGDTATGIASTNMGELFINYDLGGVAVGMLLTGVFYKMIFSNCHQRFPFFVMLYALMWPILIHGMESPVTVLYPTAIKMITLCLIAHIAITFKLGRNSEKHKFVSA